MTERRFIDDCHEIAEAMRQEQKASAMTQTERREEIARIIDGVGFRPQHISGAGLSETEKEKWLRARNAAYYKADAILALPPCSNNTGVREALEKAAKKEWPWQSTSAEVNRNIFIRGGEFALTILWQPGQPAPTGMREALPSAETMLTYASILEKPQYQVDPKTGQKYPLATGEIVEAACAALRFCAALAAPQEQEPKT